MPGWSRVSSGSLLRALAVPAMAAATVCGTGCVDIISAASPRYTDTEERRFEVTGQPDLELATFDGGIEVHTWDRPEVLVVIERRSSLRSSLKDIEVTARQEGGHIVVEARAHQGFEFASKAAYLTVSMPASGNITARTGDGSIALTGVSGHMTLQSGDGRISGDALSGDITAHTGDGSIRLVDINGSLNIQTGDGSVTASGRFSGVQARTGDGSVSITATNGSAVERDWDIYTGDGQVTLELPDAFNANLEAHTGDGRIRLDDAGLRDESRDRKQRTVRGRLGDGGGPLRVRSGDGSITIHRF